MQVAYGLGRHDRRHANRGRAFRHGSKFDHKFEGQKSLARVALFNFIKICARNPFITVGARSLSAFDFDIAFGN